MLYLEIFTGILLFCSAVPAMLFLVNLGRYRAPRFGEAIPEKIAVLIPARDEELNIGDCLDRLLVGHEVNLEVFVLDDDSADRTAAVVLDYAQRDPRVTLLQTSGPPRGWNGKQYACWQLARATNAPLMLFLDADVRLKPWALARTAAALRRKNLKLLSGFPRQITIGFTEKLLLPLMHFILMSFLPMGRMRRTTKPAYAAGCGQFMLVDREAYFSCGGHSAIRETRHDGLRLPRLFRETGFRTGLTDLTRLAAVRMYDSAGAVWRGLSKNATEGIGAPARIVPFTLLLLFGQVLPVMALFAFVALFASMIVTGATFDDPLKALAVFAGICIAVAASYVPRLIAVGRFHQPLSSALLHPVGICALLLLQWVALIRQLLGRPVGWRTRQYASNSGEEVG